MKKYFILWTIVIATFCSPLFADEYRVAVFDYDIRPTNVKTVAKHIEKRLKETHLVFRQIDQYTGGEDFKKSANVLKKLEMDNYDLIITITSDAIVPAYHNVKKTPWLFTNVNNPMFFGVQNLQKPGRNMSGVTYYVPVAEQLKFFQQVSNSSLNSVGVIFDNQAKSRKVEVREFRTTMRDMGMEFQWQIINKKEDLAGATRKLIGKNVDAIVVTSSGKLYKNIDKMLNIASKRKIPIFSVNKKGVQNGAIAAFASDYYTMVDECLIPMVIEVLEKGKSPGDLPVRHLKNASVYLNLSQAKKLNIEISKDLKKRAKKLF